MHQLQQLCGRTSTASAVNRHTYKSLSTGSAHPALSLTTTQPARQPSHLSSSRKQAKAASSGRLFSMSQAAEPQPAVLTSESGLLYGDTFFLDNFAVRQWDDPNYSGTRIQYHKTQFVQRVHQLFKEQGSQLVDGYAPFCKHVFVPNFVGARVGALEITAANKHLLQSAYTSRRQEELAVLTRWFPEASVQPVPEAKHLDIILYSREQLLQEYKALPTKAAAAAVGPADDESLLPNVPWGIISVKAQDEPYETPMQPITMMRNALGREEGGSGVQMDRQAYQASVHYWQKHAAIVAGEQPSGE